MSLKLDTNQRKKIEKRRCEERDSRIHCRLSAILWLAEGCTAEEVAQRLGMTSRQVRKWLKLFTRKGLDGLCELHYRRRVARLDDVSAEELKQEIAKGVFRTARQIAEWLETRFGITCSESGVKTLLGRIGVSYHKVTGFLWKADPVAQEEWLDRYRCDPVGPRLRRYFIDACHPIWGTDMIYSCWLLIGQRFHVKVGCGRARMNILGAYCPEDHDCVDLRLTKKDTTSTGHVSWNCWRRYRPSIPRRRNSSCAWTTRHISNARQSVTG